MRLVKYTKILKFLTSGSLAALTEYLTFIVLHHTDLFLLAANAISFFCGLLVSFMLNKHWVFSRKGNGPKQFVQYALLAGLNLLISSGVIVLLVDGLHMAAVFAKICVMLLIATWNYLIFKKIIFRPENRNPAN